VVVAYFKLLAQHLSEGTKEIHRYRTENRNRNLLYTTQKC